MELLELSEKDSVKNYFQSVAHSFSSQSEI